MRVVVAGDPHYQALARKYENWRELTNNVYKQVCDYAAIHGIKHVIFLGDIFDLSAPPQTTIQAFYEFFLNYPKLEFHFLKGNHDTKDDNHNSMQLLEFLSEREFAANMHFYLKPTLCRLGKTWVHFLPWPHHKAAKKASVVCAHLPVKGSKGDNGFTLKSDVVPPKNTFWFIGDLHTYQEGSNWVFPGALLQLKVNDSHKRYFLDVQLKEKNKPVISRQRLTLQYRIRSRKISTVPKDWRFLDAEPQENVKWVLRVGQEIVVPDHPNIIQVLPLVKGAKMQESNPADVAEPAQFKNPVRKFLKEQGLSKKELKRHMSLLNEVAKEVQERELV